MKHSKRYIKKQQKKELINKKVLQHIIRESNLCQHAIKELKLAGYGGGEGGPNDWMYQQVLEAIAVFSSHGNSGMSAPWEINLVKRLCNWDVISPLRFTDDEWEQISADGTYQNKRKSGVFKEPDGSIHYNGAFTKRATGKYSLSLKNGLKIKALFVGVEDYLSIKIMFLLEDILVLVFYGTMKLIMDGHLNPQGQLTVLK